MKIDFWSIVLILIIAGGGYYWWHKNDVKKKEAARIAYQKQLEEEERIKEEKVKKAEALVVLRNFISREENKLNVIIEEAEIAIESTKEDQGQLTDALKKIEAKAKEQAERARKRKQKYYNNAERVLLLLKDEDINALANKYMGEDLSASAMRAEYEDRVKTILRMHKESSSRLSANQKRYHDTVAGIQEGVEKKNTVAANRIREAYEEAKRTMNKYNHDIARLEKEYHTLNKGMKGVRERKRMADIQREIFALKQSRILADQDYKATRAQMAHMEATSAESAARQKYDTAIEVRQTADSNVHKDMQHESNIFHLATEYENRSLDLIRNGIKNRIANLRDEIIKARGSINYMKSTASNMDFLTSADLEKMREKIAKKLTEGVDQNMSDR